MVWLTTVKDLRRRLRDPWSFVFWVGIPLALGVLLVAIFGRAGNVQPQGRIFITDLDGTVASEILAGVFARGPLTDLFEVETTTEPDGRARMDNGEASALLVIPDGFGDAALRGTPVTLTLVTNPAQRIMPGLAAGILDVTSDFLYYIRAYFPEEADRLAAQLESGPNGDALAIVSEIAEAIDQLQPALEQLQAEIQNPRISLVTEVSENPKRAFNIGELFFGSTLFMALFFTAQGLSEDYWRENDEGTLRRAATTPAPFGALIAGKILVALIVGLAVAGLGLLVATVLFEMRPASFPQALAWAVGSIALFYCLMSSLQLLASSRRMGGILTSAAMLPLLMLGGSFFPFELMPPFLANIGRWTPNGWALARYREVLAGDIPAAEFFASLLGLAALTCAFAFLLQRLVRRRFVGT